MQQRSTESNVDVLIIGAGPSGLMAATWLSHMGVQTRIVDKRGAKIVNGHADGLHIRTLEIFDSFGLANKIMDRSAKFVENCAWAPNERGQLHRVNSMPAFSSEMSRFPPQTLHQGDIEKILIDDIKARSELQVERGIEPTSLEIDKSNIGDADAYPVTVDLRHLEPSEITTQEIKSHCANGQPVQPMTAEGNYGEAKPLSSTNHVKSETPLTAHSGNEVVHAKYVLGCEGAHSWTRRRLDFNMEGSSTDSVWGVMDIIPITDFPDIRKFSSIQSQSGTVITVPRENKLVRLYIQLEEVGAGESADNTTSKMGAKEIFTYAHKVLSPTFKFEYSYCDWWTVFRVGQRVSNRYAQSNRVFLVGDAVHTHTPKAGQGMNVSMQDAYNLCWKLGGVIKGLYHDGILNTYETERRTVAQQLISFDRELSRVLEGRSSQDETHRTYRKQAFFLSGIVKYEIGFLTHPPLDSFLPLEPDVASEDRNGQITLGQRFPSYEIFSQASSCPVQTQHLLSSNGRWSIIVFGGNLQLKFYLRRINMLGKRLSRTLGRIGTSGAGDGPFRVYLIHAAKRDQVRLSDLDSIFFPFSHETGYDYDRVFSSEPLGKAHQYYGVDPSQECVAVVRPDQHVSFLGGYDDIEKLDDFFDGIFIRQTKQQNGCLKN